MRANYIPGRRLRARARVRGIAEPEPESESESELTSDVDGRLLGIGGALGVFSGAPVLGLVCLHRVFDHQITCEAHSVVYITG